MRLRLLAAALLLALTPPALAGMTSPSVGAAPDLSGYATQSQVSAAQAQATSNAVTQAAAAADAKYTTPAQAAALAPVQSVNSQTGTPSVGTVKSVQGISPDGNGSITGLLTPAAAASTYTTAAQAAAASPVQSVNGKTGSITIQAGNFVGSYAMASLPTCAGASAPNGSMAYVTDLGGGANIAKCIGGNWQHVSLGIPQTVSQTSGTFTVTPLQNSNVLTVSGIVTVGTTLSVSIATANLYPGYLLYVLRPGILAGTMLINVSGTGVNLPILGTSRNAFIWDGSVLTQIQ